MRLLLSTARYVPIYRGRLGKFRHRGTSRCYAGNVEAAPPYVNDFLATSDGLPGDAKLRRVMRSCQRPARTQQGPCDAQRFPVVFSDRPAVPNSVRRRGVAFASRTRCLQSATSIRSSAALPTVAAARCFTLCLPSQHECDQVNWVLGPETHNGANKNAGMRAMTRTNSGTGPFPLILRAIKSGLGRYWNE